MQSGDQLAQDVVLLLPDLARSIAFLSEQTRRDAASGEVTVAQVRVAIHLYRRGHLRMADLATGLGISMPATTEVVDKMVRGGLVERVRGERDRRVVEVRLTEAASALAERMLALQRQQVIWVLSQLAPEEQSGFVRGISLLARALRESGDSAAAVSG